MFNSDLFCLRRSFKVKTQRLLNQPDPLLWVPAVVKMSALQEEENHAGDRVITLGLVSSAELNGSSGEATKFFPDTQRWAVCVDLSPETQPVELNKAIQVKNLSNDLI